MPRESASMTVFGDAALADAQAPEEARRQGTVIVVGNFDGVHRGHQAVLAAAVAEARQGGHVPAVLTFSPHPTEVLGKGSPALLTTMDRRRELMAEVGVACVFVRRFDLAFAAWSPERFAKALLAETLAARVVVVGENFRFGAKRAGDLATLQALGATYGFSAHAPRMVGDEQGNYSSTRVREAVARGALREATEILGRPHELHGVVVHGDKRGRQLGFPTANLDEVEEMLPPHGVYAVRVFTAEADKVEPLGPAVMNIGVRPTVAGQLRPTREVHVLTDDPNRFGDGLYGKRLRVCLVERLREERRFDGLEALKAQIAADAQAARALLER
jgi:riboflavin kinase/FMN adenylyltransferase